MNAGDMVPMQAKAISAWLTPTMLQLLRLRQQMVEVGVPEDDPLFRLVIQAGDSTRQLSAELTAIERKR